MTYRLAEESPPTGRKQLVSVLGLDVRRVLNVAPWELRESVARLEHTLLLHLESRLLTHRSVKDVVAGEKSGEQENAAPDWEHVVLGFRASHVENGVAVGEWTNVSLG